MIEQLFDKGPCGFFAFTDDAILLSVNETLASDLNTTAQSLEGKNVESIFTIPTRIFFQTHLYPLLKMKGHAEEIFISLQSSDGKELPVILNAKRMESEGRTVNCCVCIKMPNRKKFEDELVAARNTAEKALRENTELNKVKEELQNQAYKLNLQVGLIKRQNQELKQFNHVVTHNLKEPLRKIILYTGILGDEVHSPIFEKLQASNETMKKIISGLQQYVWLDEKPTNFTEIDLDQVIKQAAKELKGETGQTEFEIIYNQTEKLEADEEQIQLLLYHIFSNSVKFRREEKPTIFITSTLVKQNLLRQLEDKYLYEDFVRIEITDNGIGFNSSYSQQLFELFRKLHYNSGLGLGLALAKKITDNHHGIIKAESEENNFTKITILLPLKQRTPL
ncbi:MAG TPA: ATP-binding protein [Flavisolibacter sp.]|nr:ATP-binding protein [Flavisolibacter sp.]